MEAKHNFEEADFSKLDAFQSIDMESDWNRVSQSIGLDKIRALKKRRLAIAWKAAASIIVFLGIGYLSQQYLFSPGNMISVLAENETMQVVLDDGSRVTLNSSAELFYPQKFRGNTREVRLSGEAFFEVERNPDKPFMVSIEEKAMVEVLGTSFNIRSEERGESISLLVVEGRVALSDAKGNLPGIILEKDEQATLRQGILQREEAVNKNMLSWKTGMLFFDQSFIGDVVNQLESHYKRNILLNEDIPGDLMFTSTIDNQNLESVLEELSLVLGLTVSYEDDKILISKML